MHREPAAAARTPEDAVDRAWRDDRSYLVGMAARLLGDRAAAEDVVQEAFGRLGHVAVDEIDDVRGWLAVVVRRLSLTRLRSAYVRHESPVEVATPDALRGPGSTGPDDPADRVTLDDQIRLALDLVLDRLSPAERTAFVLHDVFGLPFAAVGEIVGRTPTACRQLASRARRAIRAEPGRPRTERGEADDRAVVVERFIAACAGGDMGELVAVLDPGVVGEAVLVGRGPLLDAAGAHVIAPRLLGLFGPGTGAVLTPLAVDGEPGIVAFVHGRVAAVIRLHTRAGVVDEIHAFVTRPA